jgi:hypothetical protein
VSKRRKQYLQNQKRNKKLIIIIAILLVLIFGLGMIFAMYSNNIAKKSMESFVPNDLISFAIVDINKDSKQNVKLTEIAKRMGNDKTFSDYLQSLVLAGITPDDLKIDENTFYGWLGKKIAVGNIRVTNDRFSKIFLVEIKNRDLLNNFLNIFDDNLEKKGYVVAKEDFRGNEITNITRKNNLTYAIYDNYLLVSEFPDGLKKMIDTKLGNGKALAYDGKYKKAKNKLNNQDGVVFVYGDVLELMKVFLKSNLKLDDDIMGKLKEIGGKYYAGAKFSASDDKILAKIYMPELYKISDNKKIKPKFADFVSESTAFYMEGASLKPTLTSFVAGNSPDPNAEFALISRGVELDYGIDLNEFLDLLSGQYGIYLAPDFTNEKIRVALMIDIKGKDNAQEKFNKVEGSLAKLIKKYLNDDKDANFITRKNKDITYKIMNLPKKAFDLGYFVKDDKLVIFSSEKILDNFQSDDKLNSDADFKELANSKTEQLIFISIDDLLKLSSNFGGDKNTASLAQSLGAIRITKNRKWSGNFIDAEITVK